MENDSTKKPTGAPGVFDVSKPGKSGADASARPIIVTSRPMVKDPMMSAKTAPEVTPEPAPVKKDDRVSRQGVTIQPLGTVDGNKVSAKPDTKEVDEAPVTPVAVKSEKPADAEEAPKAEAPDTKPAETETPTSKPESSPEADDGEQKPTTLTEQESEVEMKRQQAIEQLVAGRQYSLPIRAAKGGATKTIILLLGSLLVIAILLELAVDAGLIDIGIQPIVDLIKN